MLYEIFTYSISPVLNWMSYKCVSTHICMCVHAHPLQFLKASVTIGLKINGLILHENI